MTKPRLLISGLNGLIGWNLFQAAREKFETYGTFARAHGVLSQPHCFRVNLDDSKSLELLLKKTNPEYLIHARAICDLDLCENCPGMAEEINVEGTRKLAEALTFAKNLKKWVYVSTDHVFDGEKGNYHEQDEPLPIHVYGRTKLAAERIVAQAGMPYLIIRPGLTIGSSLQGNKGPRDFLASRIRSGKPTHLFVDEWRSPIRAHVLAERILLQLTSGGDGIFHMAGNRIHNRFDLGRLLAHEMNLDTKHIHPRRRKEDRWAHIRPKDLSLTSLRGPLEPFAHESLAHSACNPMIIR